MVVEEINWLTCEVYKFKNGPFSKYGFLYAKMFKANLDSRMFQNNHSAKQMLK